MIATATERRVAAYNGTPVEVITDPACPICEGFGFRLDGEPGTCPDCARCQSCGITKVRIGNWHNEAIVDDAVAITDGLCADCRFDAEPECPACLLHHDGGCDPISRHEALMWGLVAE